MKDKCIDNQKVIRQWLELDLTEAAAAGQLAPAYEVESEIAQICDLLAAGCHPVVAGEPGVGKTAIVHELARRTADGRGPASLLGRRIWQFSLRKRAAGLAKPAEKLRPELDHLVAALLEAGTDIVPFFRDFHLAYSFDLEAHFVSLSVQLAGPILCEGSCETVNAMMEHHPELEQRFIPVYVREPDLEKTARVLNCWGLDQAREHGRFFADEALDTALQFSHRFLSRTRLPRKVLDLLGQLSATGKDGRTVTASDVIERFCLNTRVPRVLVDPDVKLDLDELAGRFGRRVLGQPEAVQTVVQTVGAIKAGMADPRRPFGVFLFVGPTGVGKTHVAQMLAEYLFGGSERLLRFNMADHQEEKSATLLFGDPDGYSPPERRGLLTQRLMGHPFCVLLLDELEKAHARVLDRFLQLMDEGSFINGAGELISCRSTIIIATSNAGAETYRGEVLGFARASDPAARDRVVNRELEKHFRFELLNRFDRIVHFRPLGEGDIRQIARGELRRLQERSGLRQRDVTLEIEDDVIDWLVAQGFNADFGARFLRRTIERHVATTVADALIRHQPPPGSRIVLVLREGRIQARVDEPLQTVEGDGQRLRGKTLAGEKV